MQYAWLEKMAQEGHVRPEVKDAIYADCSRVLHKYATEYQHIDPAQLKRLAEGTADAVGVHVVNALGGKGGKVKAPRLTGWEKFMKRMAPVQQGLALAMGIGIPAALIGSAIYRAPGAVSEREAKKLKASRDSIFKNTDFGPHTDKAYARFDELVRISPLAASQPAIAGRILKERLHSGLTAQDAQNLALYQSSEKGYSTAVIPRIATEASKTASAILPMSPEKMGELCADMVTLVKEAAGKKPIKYWEAFKSILPAMGIVTGAHLLTAAGVGTAHMIGSSIKKKKLEEQLQKSYADAMRQSDPNREPLHANKEKAQRAFQTLVHFSPQVATDPSAARAFMNSIVSQDLGTHIGTVKELSEIERNLGQVKVPHPFVEGLREGAQLTGMGKAIGGTTKELFSPIVAQGEHDLASALGMKALKPKYEPK